MNTLTAASIVANAIRLGIDAFHTATGLDLAAPVEGSRWIAICPWCLESKAPQSVPVHRIGIGGCECCPYNGRDVLVAAIPD